MSINQFNRDWKAGILASYSIPDLLKIIVRLKAMEAQCKHEATQMREAAEAEIRRQEAIESEKIRHLELTIAEQKEAKTLKETRQREDSKHWRTIALASGSLLFVVLGYLSCNKNPDRVNPASSQTTAPATQIISTNAQPPTPVHP